MGGKRRKLQLKQQQANGKAGGSSKPAAARAFIPNRHSDRPLPGAGPSSGGRAQLPNKKQRKKAEEQKQRQLRRNAENPTIPFDADDRILLVGEGDLSFAASIIRHHRCRHVTATVLDKDHAELVAKYPTADANIAVVHGVKLEKRKKQTEGEEEEGQGKDTKDGADVKGQQDATTSDGADNGKADGQADQKPPGDSHDPDEETADESETDSDYDADGNHRPRAPKTNRLLYAVDAAKLTPSLTRAPLFQRILFNFPHVGGRSTDVNRQVRANQELLVSFFRRALSALAPGGTVVVTLFEGEPYTLWNVRDLARHVGLQAGASFRFSAAAYPGYRHARTLGVVVRSRKSGGGGGEGGGEQSATAWRGEDRPSRSYVFVRKGDVVRLPAAMMAASKKAVKRKRGGSDDEGESSDEDLD